jgi:hypothetical protein
LTLPNEAGLEELMEAMNYEIVQENSNQATFKKKRVPLRERYQLRNLHPSVIKEQYRDYFRLWKEEPEFGLYEKMSIMSNIFSGSLLGAINPSFFDYGGLLELAGTLNAIQKIGTPLTNVLVSSSMGKLVDKANKASDLEDLKQLQKKVGKLYVFLTADTFLMQKDIVAAMPSPEVALLTLYALQTIGATAGRMALESKTHFAIRDYLIRQNPDLDEESKDKFYQILGSGQALGQLGYAISFAVTWGSCMALPALIPYVAGVAGASLLASKFAWAYMRRIKNPVTVEGNEFLERDGTYIFDSGWELEMETTPLVKRRKRFELPLLDEIVVSAAGPIEYKDDSLQTTDSRIKLPEKHEIEQINDNQYKIKPRPPASAD